MSEFDRPSLTAISGSNVTPLLPSERATGEDAHALLEAVQQAKVEFAQARFDAQAEVDRAGRDAECRVAEATTALQRAIFKAQAAGLKDAVYDLDPAFLEAMEHNEKFLRLD